MAKKCYHAENAGRGPIGGVRFEVYEIVAGSAFGVYASEDPAVIEQLDALAKNPKTAVTLIATSEYDVCIKKKASRPGSDSYPALRQPLPQQAATIKGQPASPVAVIEPTGKPVAEEETPVTIDKTVETVEDALQVEQVAPAPMPEQPTDPAKGKLGKKGK